MGYQKYIQTALHSIPSGVGVCRLVCQYGLNLYRLTHQPPNLLNTWQRYWTIEREYLFICAGFIQFISKIKGLPLTGDDTMVSLDVQSLFTSLPPTECIQIVRKKLREHNMPLNMQNSWNVA